MMVSRYSIISTPALVAAVAVLVLVANAQVDKSWCEPAGWCYDGSDPQTQYYLDPKLLLPRTEAEDECFHRHGTLISFASADQTKTRLRKLLPGSWDGAWSGLEELYNATTKTSTHRFSNGDAYGFDMLVTGMQLPCFTISEYSLGVALDGVICEEPRKVACQRVGVSTPWTAASPGLPYKWKFFASTVSFEDAKALCAREGGVVGFLPDLDTAKKIGRQMFDSYFSNLTVTEYRRVAMWVNLDYDQVSGGTSWRDSHTLSQWSPPLDNTVSGTRCVLMEMAYRGTTVVFRTASCAESYSVYCTKPSYIVTISLPDNADVNNFTSRYGQSSTADDAQVGFVTVVPPAGPAPLTLRITSDTEPLFTIPRPHIRIPAGGSTAQFLIERDLTSPGPNHTTDVEISAIVSDADRRGVAIESTIIKPPAGGSVITPPNPVSVQPNTFELQWSSGTTPYFAGETFGFRVVSLGSPPNFGLNLTISPIDAESGSVVDTASVVAVTPNVITFDANPASLNPDSTNINVRPLVAGNFTLRLTVTQLNGTLWDVGNSELFYFVATSLLRAPIVVPGANRSRYAIGETFQYWLDAAILPPTTVGGAVVPTAAEWPLTGKSFTFPSGASQTLTSSSADSGFALDIQCVSTGNVSLVFYFGTGTTSAIVEAPFRNPSTSQLSAQLGQLPVSVVYCEEPVKMVMSPVQPTMVIGAYNKQRIGVTLHRLPEDGELALEISCIDADTLAPATCVDFDEGSQLTWMQDSYKSAVFSVTGLDECQCTLTFQVLGKTAALYLPPPTEPISVLPRTKVTVDDYTPVMYSGGIANIASFDMDIGALPLSTNSFGIEVETVPPGLIRFYPARPLFFVGRSKNATQVHVFMNADEAVFLTLGVDEIEVNVTFSVVGTASTEYDVDTMPFEITIRRLKTIRLSESLIMVSPRVNLSTTFQVFVSSLPDDGTELTVRLETNAIPFFVQLQPSSMDFFSNVSSPTVTITATGIQQMMSPVPLTVSVNGSALYQYDVARLDEQLTIPLQVFARPSVILSSAPRVVVSEENQGRLFFISLSEQLLPGEEIKVNITLPEPRFYDSTVISPWSYTFTATDRSAVPFKVFVWKIVDEPIFVELGVSGSASARFSPTADPRSWFSFRVVSMAHVIPVVTPIAYLGDELFMTVAIARLPMKLNPNSLLTPYLSCSPTYAGVSGALRFLPQVVHFRSSLPQSQTLAVKLKAEALSDAAPISFQMSGPLLQEYIAFELATVEIRRLSFNLSFPNRSIVRDTVYANVTIEQLPECGYVTMEIECFQCDSYVFLPRILIWTPTSDRKVTTVILGQAAASLKHMQFQIIQAGCGVAAKTDFLYTSSLELGYEPGTRVALVSSTGRNVLVLPSLGIEIVPKMVVDLRNGYDADTPFFVGMPEAPVRVWIRPVVSEEFTHNRGSYFEVIAEGRAVYSGVLYDNVSEVISYDALTVQPTYQLEIRSSDTRFPATTYFPVTISNPIVIGVLNFAPGSTYTVGATATFTLLFSGSIPDANATFAFEDSPYYSFADGGGSSIHLVPSSPLGFSKTIRFTSPVSNFTLIGAVSGPSARYFDNPTQAVQVHFATITAKGASLFDAVTGVKITDGQVFNISVGTQITLYMVLDEKPGDEKSVVWAQPILDKNGYVAIKDSDSLYWTAATYSVPKYFSIEGLAEPFQVEVSLIIFSTNGEFQTPISTRFSVAINSLKSVVVDGFLNEVFVDGEFQVSVYPSSEVEIGALIIIPDITFAKFAGVGAKFFDYLSVAPLDAIWFPGMGNDPVVFSFNSTGLSGASFYVQFTINGNSEYSREPPKDPLTIIGSGTVAVQGWQPLLVVGELNNATITIEVDNLPHSNFLLRVRLDAPFDSVRADPSEVQFGSLDQQMLEQTITLIGVKPLPRQDIHLVLFGPAVSHYVQPAPQQLEVVETNSITITPKLDINVYTTEPQVISLAPNYIPLMPIFIRMAVRCDLECQQTLLLPGDFKVEPDVIFWDPGVGQADKTPRDITITALTTGKSFLLDFIPYGDYVSRIDPIPSMRVRFPAPIFARLGKTLPPTLYVQYRFETTVSIDVDVGSGYATVTPQQEPQGVVEFSPVAVKWTRQSSAFSKPILIRPLRPGAVNISWITESSLPNKNFYAPALQTLLVFDSTYIRILGMPRSLFSGGDIADIEIIPSVLIPVDVIVMLRITVNDSTALTIEPREMSLSGFPKRLTSLVPKSFTQVGSRPVKVTFTTISYSGEYVVVPDEQVVVVRKQKEIRLHLYKQFVSAGSTEQGEIEILDPPEEGEVLVIEWAFSGGVVSLQVSPFRMFFTKHSKTKRAFTIYGLRQSSRHEVLSFYARNASEFSSVGVSQEFFVRSAIFVASSLPRQIGISNMTSCEMWLSERVSNSTTVIIDMLVVRIVATPNILLFDPPEIRFDSDEKTRKPFAVRGLQKGDGVFITFELTGALSHVFEPPDDQFVDVLDDATVKIGIPPTTVVDVGKSPNFDIEIPQQLLPYETFTLEPLLSCPTFSLIAILTPTTLEWTHTTPLKQVLTLTGVKPSTCSLTFSVSGNASRVRGNGGAWTFTVVPLRSISLSRMPQYIIASTQTSVQLEVSLDSAPRAKSFELSISVLPQNATMNQTFPVSINPRVLQFLPGELLQLVRNVTLTATPFADYAKPVTIVFQVSDTTEIVTTNVPPNVTLPFEKAPAIYVHGLPSSIYPTSVNSITVQIELAEEPRPGEIVDLEISFTGSPGSLFISPRRTRFDGSSSFVTRTTQVYLEGIRPQISTSLKLSVSGSPRFARIPLLFPLEVRQLSLIGMKPEFPVLLHAHSVTTLEISLGDVDVTDHIMTVEAAWKGRPGCVFFTPSLLRFSVATGTKMTTQLRVQDNCGVGSVEFTTYGWRIFEPTPFRSVLETTSLSRMTMDPLPRIMTDSESFLIMVDIDNEPRAYDIFQFGFVVAPWNPCLKFEPSFLNFRGGDNLPTKRAVRVETLCAVEKPFQVSLTTQTSNSTRHSKFYTTQTVQILAAVSEEVPFEFRMPSTVVAGAENSFSAHLQAYNLTLGDHLTLLVSGQSSLKRTVEVTMLRNFDSQYQELVSNVSFASVNGITIPTGDEGAIVVPLSAASSLEDQLEIAGFGFPGGQLTFTFVMTSDSSPVSTHLVDVLPQVLFLRGELSIDNGFRATIEYVLHEYSANLIAPAIPPYVFFKTQEEAFNTTMYGVEFVVAENPANGNAMEPMPRVYLYKGRENRILYTVLASQLPVISDGGVGVAMGLLPQVDLLVTSNDSAVTFSSDTISWRASDDVGDTKRDFYLETSTTTDVTAVVTFNVSGSVGAYVDEAVLKRMTFVVEAKPLQRLVLCELPPLLYPGLQNSIQCNITNPVAEVASARIVLSGSVESISVVPNYLTWDPPVIQGNTSTFQHIKTVTIYGQFNTGSPVTLSTAASGQFLEPTPLEDGKRHSLEVVPLLQMYSNATDPTQIIFLYVNLSYAMKFYPVDAPIVITPSEDGVFNISYLAGNVVVFKALKLSSKVTFSTAIDPNYEFFHRTKPPPSFDAVVRKKKQLFVQGRHGYIEHMDVWVHTSNVLEVVLEAGPETGSLVISPSTSSPDSYSLSPQHFVFEPGDGMSSVIFTFVGVTEESSRTIHFDVSGPAVQEYDMTEFKGMQLTVRRRVVVQVPGVEPVNELATLQFLGIHNRQRVTIELLNRTTTTVDCALAYHGPDPTSVLFVPPLVTFLPVLSGTEFQQRNTMQIIALKSAEPADVELTCIGPAEFNSRRIPLGAIRFANLRQVSVDRVGFTDEIFVRSINKKFINIGLVAYPDLADVKVTVVATGGEAGVTITPSHALWPVGGVRNGTQYPLMQPIELVGANVTTVSIELEVITTDLRYNMTLPLQKFNLKIRPLITITPLFDNKPITDVIRIYAGVRNSVQLVIVLADLPVHLDERVLVNPSLTTSAISLSNGEGTITFGHGVNGGALNGTLGVTGELRVINGSTDVPPGLPPRRGRILFSALAPTEFLRTVNDATFDVVDQLAFEHKGFNGTMVVGLENDIFFSIRPLDPPVAGTLNLTARSNCLGLVLIEFSGLTWAAGEHHWATITLRASALVNMCPILVLTDYTASTVSHYREVPFRGSMNVTARPHVELADTSAPELYPRTLREQGVLLTIRLHGSLFKRQLFLGWDEKRHPTADVMIASDVDRLQEPSSVHSQLALNGTSFVSHSVSDDGRMFLVRLNPAPSLFTRSVEHIRVTFKRTALITNKTLEPSHSFVEVTLRRDLVKMMDDNVRWTLQTVLAIASLSDGIFNLALATVPAQASMHIISPMCPQKELEFSDTLFWNEKILNIEAGTNENGGPIASIGYANFLFIVLFALMHIGLSCLSYLWRLRGSYLDKSYASALWKVAFPKPEIFLCFFFYQSITTSALRTVLTSPSPVLRSASGAIFVLYSLGFPTYVAIALHLNFHCVYTHRDHTQEALDDEAEKKAAAEDAAAGSDGGALSLNNGKKHDQDTQAAVDQIGLQVQRSKKMFLRMFYTHGSWAHTSDTQFIRRYGILFVELLPNRRIASLAALLFAFFYAMLTSPNVSTQEGCNGKLSLMAVGCFFQVLFYLILRPYDQAIHTIYSATANFMMLVVALFVVSGFAAGVGDYWGHDAATFLVILLCVVTVIRAGLDIIVWFLATLNLSRTHAGSQFQRFVMEGITGKEPEDGDNDDDSDEAKKRSAEAAEKSGKTEQDNVEDDNDGRAETAGMMIQDLGMHRLAFTGHHDDAQQHSGEGSRTRRGTKVVGSLAEAAAAAGQGHQKVLLVPEVTQHSSGTAAPHNANDVNDGFGVTPIRAAGAADGSARGGGASSTSPSVSVNPSVLQRHLAIREEQTRASTRFRADDPLARRLDQRRFDASNLRLDESTHQVVKENPLLDPAEEARREQLHTKQRGLRAEFSRPLQERRELAAEQRQCNFTDSSGTRGTGALQDGTTGAATPAASTHAPPSFFFGNNGSGEVSTPGPFSPVAGGGTTAPSGDGLRQQPSSAPLASPYDVLRYELPTALTLQKRESLLESLPPLAPSSSNGAPTPTNRDGQQQSRLHGGPRSSSHEPPTLHPAQQQLFGSYEHSDGASTSTGGGGGGGGQLAGSGGARPYAARQQDHDDDMTMEDDLGRASEAADRNVGKTGYSWIRSRDEQELFDTL